MARLLSYINQFNWVDIFVAILLLRTSYIAIKTGIFIEFFKLLGTLFACYLSLHYFTRLSDFVEAHVPGSNLVIWDFLAFFILLIAGYLILVILRATLFRFIKAEAVSLLNKWGALLLGISRGFILTSLVIFFFSIPAVAYFNNSVKGSFSGRRLIKVSTGVYTSLWKNVVSKFMPKEEFNKTAREVQEDILK